MAVVKPFRAVRYDERRAGPLPELVAPPYDVVSDEEREGLRQKSPYNVVHLTLPGDEAEAARLWRDWQRDGVLARDTEPAAWALSQEYVGPDGVARTRSGVVCSLRVEPYERRVVLPHERTHAGPKEGRLRLLRALRAHVEPIFLLHEGPPVELPERPPDLEVDGTRAWRVSPETLHGFEDRQLLIADGHHRYETALAFHEAEGSEESAYLMAVLVSTRQTGLTIFPTHRVAQRFERPLDYDGGDPLALLHAIEARPRDRAAAVVYTPRGVAAAGGDGLDVELVERLGPQGVTYTPVAQEAVAAVDEGRADAAFLVRAPLIEDVFAVARAGKTLPQKTTYFFPKLVSGLLFHPL